MGSSRDREQLEALAAWVKTHFGISYTADQFTLFQSRVEQFLGDKKLTLDALMQRLRGGDHELTTRLAEAVSTNHTFFLREPEVLDVYRKQILPKVRDKREVRVWSAACSSGDEAYSLAILAIEEWGYAEAKSKLAILGTDISQRMVQNAESAMYPSSRLTLLSKDLLRAHFRPAPMGNYVVAPETRVLCTFRRLNLTQQPWPFQRRFHVVFLRNVLYYFEAHLQKAILNACWDQAEPGAWLVTSLTEPLHGMVTKWRMTSPGVYRKDEG